MVSRLTVGAKQAVLWRDRSCGTQRSEGLSTRALACHWAVAWFVLLAALPTGASALATIESPPIFSSVSGLSDDRVYEQVSPTQKNGNQAGSSTSAFDVGALNSYGIASPDGKAVLYEGTGPIGENPWAGSLWFVSERDRKQECPDFAMSTGTGWCTRAVFPAAQQSLGEIGGIIQLHSIHLIQPSEDLSRTMVEAPGRETLAPTLGAPCQTSTGAVDGSQLYLAGSDPFSPAVWLAQPSAELRNPVENCYEAAAGTPDGGTPNFSTVYFTYPGTLLPEDAERAPHAGTGSQVESWGFYEDHEGELREAGVLPDGRLDPFGAVPAASGHGANRVGNQVSESGERAFFVSPDPASCENGGHNDCALDPPELYVRETESEGAEAPHRTVLVSRDTLLPEAAGFPAPAPDGVSQMHNPTKQEKPRGLAASYLFASPDGSQAFFQSADALTQPAEEASPGSEPKTYDFDLESGTLTYLPGVASGEILATDRDGSAFAFVRPEEGGEQAELEWWSASPAGGRVTPVVPLSGGSISDAQVASDGSALVFVTAGSLSSAFNSGPDEQVYRYDSATNTLGCVSCAPLGVTQRGGLFGNAWISDQVASELNSVDEDEQNEPPKTISEPRAISADGDEIFFDTPNPLVPQDTNTNSPELIRKEDRPTPQGRDVYEWENGVVYLVSTGKSPYDSFLLGSSESGSNVFLSTAQGLVPADTDGGYDVYDAHLPEPSEGITATPTPCGDSTCQGSVSTPPAPSTLASESFTGLGNPSPELIFPASPTKTPVTPTVVKCKRGYVKKKDKCVRSKARRHATKSSRAGTDRRVGR
jgi:hypothetical protein